MAPATFGDVKKWFYTPGLEEAFAQARAEWPWFKQWYCIKSQAETPQ